MLKNILSLVVATSLGLGAAGAQSAGSVALVGGRLIDGFGGTPLDHSVVLIDGERIKAVGTIDSLPVPPGTTVISTAGMTVLPGLWDAHVHTYLLGHSDYAHWDTTYGSSPRLAKEIMPAAAHQLLLAGITSARDLGAPLEASIEVRDRINRGEFPAPPCTSPARSSSTRRIPVRSIFAGASTGSTTRATRSKSSPRPV